MFNLISILPLRHRHEASCLKSNIKFRAKALNWKCSSTTHEQCSRRHEGMHFSFQPLSPSVVREGELRNGRVVTLKSPLDLSLWFILLLEKFLPSRAFRDCAWRHDEINFPFHKPLPQPLDRKLRRGNNFKAQNMYDKNWRIIRSEPLTVPSPEVHSSSLTSQMKQHILFVVIIII